LGQRCSNRSVFRAVVDDVAVGNESLGCNRRQQKHENGEKKDPLPGDLFNPFEDAQYAPGHLCHEREAPSKTGFKIIAIPAK
jgi:hypothetical protein